MKIIIIVSDLIMSARKDLKKKKEKISPIQLRHQTQHHNKHQYQHQTQM